MPSSSKKQHNLMAMVANNPSKAKELGIPQKVGADFTKADKGKTFKSGGSMATKMNAGFMAMMKKKSDAKPTKKMADGGMSMVKKDGKMVPDFAADGKGKMAKGGMAMKKMASGGMTSMGKVKTGSSPDGVVAKGKTKGTMVKMAGAKKMKSGGYC